LTKKQTDTHTHAFTHPQTDTTEYDSGVARILRQEGHGMFTKSDRNHKNFFVNIINCR